MAHADFCTACMERFAAQGWAVADRGPTYQLTEEGARHLPGYETVAECAFDATPIYRRWIDGGFARLEPEPTCPFCLGLEGMTR